MILKELYLKDFRNYEELAFTGIHPKMNIIIGENAQGKTNLMEAIHFLSCGRSFRSAPEERLIRQGCSAAMLKAVYLNNNGTGKVETALFSDKKRSVKVNGVPVKKMGDMIGRINTVIFSPEDLKTVKESPTLRRRLIDIEIAKLSPSYYTALQGYQAALKEKNLLLKADKPDFTLVDVYNGQLISYAKVIIKKRAQFFETLCKYSSHYHKLLTDNAEELNLRYRPCAELEDIEGSLNEKLVAGFQRECEQRMALIGPHREDFDIIIDEKEAKLMASQGQQRTAMISIKLACAAAADDYAGELPVLILDDVFSELDKKRRERLLGLAENFQVFISTTEIGAINKRVSGKISVVTKGQLK